MPLVGLCVVELSDCAPTLEECAREPIEDMQVRGARLAAATPLFDMGRVMGACCERLLDLWQAGPREVRLHAHGPEISNCSAANQRLFGMNWQQRFLLSIESCVLESAEPRVPTFAARRGLPLDPLPPSPLLESDLAGLGG
ncbi:unnamed protein product [Prorocentrum cordatum]|uniref:Uncharacterized protein n=1 Tax=Prorocentrum cordatum TaxID=2364126 RepID=A0ABN9RIG6_9DINO|nr:unnamed protein product [Polarella glacialis]